MTKRAARRLPDGRRSEIAGLLRSLAERVEKGDIQANFYIAIAPSSEIWMVTASVPRSSK